MSMIARCIEISPALLEKIRENPQVLDDVRAADLEPLISGGKANSFLEMLSGNKITGLAESMPPEYRQAFLKDIAAVRKAVSSAPQKATPDGVRSRLDLEQAWHGVHFLLCGTVAEAEPPLGLAVLGGVEIGPNHGYGPVRYLTPVEVDLVAKALANLDEGKLRQNWNPSAFTNAEVYPGGWETEDALMWLLDTCARLRKFYQQATENGSAVLLYIT
jgi:hypothetical protein